MLEEQKNATASNRMHPLMSRDDRRRPIGSTSRSKMKSKAQDALVIACPLHSCHLLPRRHSIPPTNRHDELLDTNLCHKSKPGPRRNPTDAIELFVKQKMSAGIIKIPKAHICESSGAAKNHAEAQDKAMYDLATWRMCKSLSIYFRNCRVVEFHFHVPTHNISSIAF